MLPLCGLQVFCEGSYFFLGLISELSYPLLRAAILIEYKAHAMHTLKITPNSMRLQFQLQSLPNLFSRTAMGQNGKTVPNMNEIKLTYRPIDDKPYSRYMHIHIQGLFQGGEGVHLPSLLDLVCPLRIWLVLYEVTNKTRACNAHYPAL